MQSVWRWWKSWRRTWQVAGLMRRPAGTARYRIKHRNRSPGKILPAWLPQAPSSQFLAARGHGPVKPTTTRRGNWAANWRGAAFRCVRADMRELWRRFREEPKRPGAALSRLLQHFFAHVRM